MNWIILIIAGLFESGFAFCLGKMKGLHGTGYYLWGCGFLVCLTLHEPVSFARIFFITTLIASIVGLKMV